MCAHVRVSVYDWENYSIYIYVCVCVSRKFIDTGAGVVDEDYTGEVKVVLFNHSEDDFKGTHTMRDGALEMTS